MDNDASLLTLLVQKCMKRPTSHMVSFVTLCHRLMLLLIKHLSSHIWIKTHGLFFYTDSSNRKTPWRREKETKTVVIRMTIQKRGGFLCH